MSRTVWAMDMRCAPLERRLLAYALDVALFFVPSASASFVALEPSARYAVLRLLALKSSSLESLGVSPESILAGEVPYRTLACFAAISVGVLAWLYYRVRTAQSGVSVGKRLLGLRIVSQEAFAANCAAVSGVSGKYAVRRVMPCAALGLLPVPGLGFLGYIACLWRKDHCGWHDEAAKSVVVQLI